MDLLPKSEAIARVRRMQAWMNDSAVDTLFILQNADQYYLSGTVQVGLFCLPVESDPVYLVQKSVSRARMESAWERIVPLAGLSKTMDVLSAEGFHRPQRIGLEMDVLPTSFYLRFKQLFPDVQFVDASGAIRKTRMTKSAYEIAQMRGAARMLSRAFDEIPGWARAGVTELEVSAQLEAFLRLQGHQGITRMRGFNHEIAYGTVSSGASASYPTCFPGPVGFIGLYPAILNGPSLRKLEAGNSLMVDIVGGSGGYIVDKTRTFSVEELDKEMYAAHEFVLSLNTDIEAMLRPGVTCSSIYRFSLDRVKDSRYAATFMGVGDSRVRFVGHGVGLELDEWPVLSPNSDAALEPGMTIAVEPKIFFPERGGVGIENTYLITEGGFEKLTPYCEEIIRVPP
ncbi:MAG TPA: Xaa-Pro peptidase family protein [Acidobacteriota bacterium]|nr:Xaa-Pro peptidase family protein [Acidobacteriota bacterium]